ncbi:MAG: class GN sortase [Alphaproteobacteria bacterium]
MIRKFILIAGFLSGGFLFGSGLWMGGKAVAAQILLERAWAKSVESGEAVRPWASMDARPVAKLTVPELGKSVIIFDRASGQSLAFGPGHMAETAPLGEGGTAAIAAHKNTHFAFLENLKAGMQFQVQMVGGETLMYRVRGADIMDASRETFTIPTDKDAPSELALITCYPFDSLSFGGPLRYIVTGEKV